MQGWGDSELTERGKAQARRHGLLLKREGVLKIYASDLGRVSQTLEGIREYCPATTHIDPNLRECNMGQWEGQRVDDIEVRQKSAYRQWCTRDESFAPPSGESVNDMKLRVRKALRFMTEGDHTDIAFVTHGITTRVLLDLLAGLTNAQKQQLHVPHDAIHKVNTDQSQTRIVHFRDGGPSINGICVAQK